MKSITRRFLLIFLSVVTVAGCTSHIPLEQPQSSETTPSQDSQSNTVPSQQTNSGTPSEGETDMSAENDGEATSSGKVFKVSQLQRPKKIVGEKLNVSQAKGVMVFVRSSVVASAVDAQIYDVSSGEPEYIGEMKNNSRLHHKLAPGKYTFMLLANSADYVIVNIEAGYAYFAVVKPSMGVWKPKFHFVPVKRDSDAIKGVDDGSYYAFDDESFVSMLSAMTPIVYANEFTGAKAERPAGKKSKVNGADGLAVNYGQVLARHRKAWSEWINQDPSAIKAKTIDKVDGQKIQ